jgi:subtilase family serine protease
MLRKTALCAFGVLVLALTLAFPFLSFSQSGHSRALITQRIDESKLITLTGNTHPSATPANDRGIVADDFQMDHMYLLLRRPAEQEKALEQRVASLTDIKSPSYHQWLTAKELGESYGLASSDITTVTNWLESHGFTVNGTFANHVLIDFSGTARQVRESFHTEIHNLEVDGVKHIANMSDPKIPAAFADAVVGVVSLTDFMPRPMYKPKSAYTIGGGTFAVVPADLGVIYNLNPLLTGGTSGQGQTVVVVEDTNVYKTSDWTTFRNTFGLSTYTAGTFTQVHPTGTTACTNPGTNGDEIEAILDAEYASAAAPSAAIELASCSDTATMFGGLIAIENLINAANPPAVMSMSYGQCEANDGAAFNATFNTTYMQAASEGVSVFVSSGDESAVSCDANSSKSTHGIGISGWTSTPYNVSVGGTDYSDTFAGTTSTYWNATNTSTFGSAKSYIPEIPWNDSCASVLIAQFFGGTSVTYGTSGFCNSALGEDEFLSTGSGSGGPSGCATGAPSISGVVSGTCAGYAKPSWQSGVAGIVADGVRDIPDVSLFAANGVWGHYYPFCDTDPEDFGTCSGAPSGWLGAGGTSFSSPIMAGIMALVNQKTGSIQGNPNPTLYSLAAVEYGLTGNASCNSTLGNAVASTCIFYDITQGDFDVNCTGTNNCYLPSGKNGVVSTSDAAYDPAYVAGTGWDFTTGLGSVNAANLVNAWPVSTTPSFTLTPSPTSLSIAQAGTAQTSTITVNPLNGFTGTVTFNVSGLPTGVTDTFTPTSSTTSSILSLSANSTATVGTSTITVTGTSGALTASASISLTVTGTGTANFTLSASPATLTVAPGATGRTTIKVTPTNGFTGSVTFSATGLPTGATSTFSPLSSTTSTHLSLKTSATTPAGTYPITVTGKSGALTNTTTVTLTVTGSTGGSFTLAASPIMVTITPGGAGGASTITVTPAGGFTGSVTFSTSTLPSGVTAVFNPTSSTTSSAVTFTASSAAVASKTAVTVTGTSGSLTAKTTVRLQVQ